MAKKNGWLRAYSQCIVKLKVVLELKELVIAEDYPGTQN